MNFFDSTLGSYGTILAILYTEGHSRRKGISLRALFPDAGGRGIGRWFASAAAIFLLILAAGCPSSSGPPPIVEPGPPVLRATAERIALTPSFFPASTPPASLALEVKLRGDPYPASLHFEAEVRVDYVAPASVGTLTAAQSLQIAVDDLTGEGLYTGQISSGTLLDLPVSTGGTIRQRLLLLGAESVSLRLAGHILGSPQGTETPWAVTNTLDSSFPVPEIVSLSSAGLLPGNSGRITVSGHNLTDVALALFDGPEGLAASALDVESDSTASLTVEAASSAAAGARTLRLLGPGGLSPANALARFAVIDVSKPVILSVTLPAGSEGTPYSVQLSHSGGTGAVSWAFRSGSFPSGLSLTSGGLLSGTPSSAAAYVFDLSVRDQALNEDRRTFVLDIARPPSDGRDALSDPCDAFADAVITQENVSSPERATGAPDPAFGTLSGRQPAVVGLSPSQISLVSQLENGSFLVLDLGPEPCEWIQARSERAADAWLDVGGPYRPALLAWLSASPATLDRLVLASVPGVGSLGTGRFPLDAGADGSLYRYLTIALNDPAPARIDAVERLVNDILPPETAIAWTAVGEDGAVQPDGNDLLSMLTGDDSQGGADPLGRVASFDTILANLTEGETGDTVSVPSADGVSADYEPADLDDGSYELSAQAVDLFGNTDPSPATALFTVDTTGPSVSGITLSAPATVIPAGGSVDITAEADVTDELSDVADVTGLLLGPGGPYLFGLTGGPVWSGTAAGIELTGTYSAEIIATDSRGNVTILTGGSMSLTANQPPAVNAGGNFSVNEQSLATLNGSATADPEGQTVTYAWTQTGGSPAVTLQGTGHTVTFFSPELVTNTPVQLTFRLTATDPYGASAFADAIVTVNNVNSPPVVNAGTDVTIPDSSTYNLNGSALDPEGDLPTYQWTQISGPAVTLSGAATTTPGFTPPSAGGGDLTLIFQLTAADSLLASASDTVTVTVSAADKPPVANAGPDQHVFDTTALALDGTASHDPEGGGLSYAWSMLSGTPAHIPGWGAVNKTTPVISLPAIQAGTDETFVFQLQVTDGALQSSTDTVQVIVRRLCPQVVSLGDASRAYGDALDQIVDGEKQIVLFASTPVLLIRDWSTGTRSELTLLNGSATRMAHDPVRRLLWAAGPSGLERVDLAALTSSTQGLTAAALDVAVETGTGRVAVLTDTAGGRLEFFLNDGSAAGTLDLGRSDTTALSVAGSPFSTKFALLDTAENRLNVVDPLGPAIVLNSVLPMGWDIFGLAANPATGDLAVTHSGGVAEYSEDGVLLVNRAFENDPPSRYDIAYNDGGELFAVRGLGNGELTTGRTLYRTNISNFSGSLLPIADPGDVAVNVPRAGERPGNYLASGSATETAVLEARGSGASRLIIVFGTPPVLAFRTVDLTNDEPLSVRASGGRYYVLTRGGDLVRVIPGEPDAISTDRPSAAVSSLALAEDGSLLAGDRRLRRVWQVDGLAGTIGVSRIETAGRTVSLAAAGTDALAHQKTLLRSGAASYLAESSDSGETLWAGPDAFSGDFLVPPVTDGTHAYAYRPGSGQIDVFEAATGTPEAPLSTTIDPVRLAVSPNGSRLAAIDPVQKKLAIFQLGTGNPEILLPTGDGPAELAFNADGTRLLVREREAGRLLVVNSAAGVSLGQIALSGAPIPSPLDTLALGRRSLVYHAASDSFYASSGTNVLRVTGNGAQSSLISPVALSNITALATAGSFIAAVDGGRRFYVIDPAENFRASRINLPVAPVDSPLQGIAGDPDGEVLYVVGDHTVTVVDLRTGCSMGRPVSYAAALPPAASPKGSFWARVMNRAQGIFSKVVRSFGPGPVSAKAAGRDGPDRYLNNPKGGGHRPSH